MDTARLTRHGSRLCTSSQWLQASLLRSRILLESPHAILHIQDIRCRQDQLSRCFRPQELGARPPTLLQRARSSLDVISVLGTQTAHALQILLQRVDDSSRISPIDSDDVLQQLESVQADVAHNVLKHFAPPMGQDDGLEGGKAVVLGLPPQAPIGSLHQPSEGQKCNTPFLLRFASCECRSRWPVPALLDRCFQDVLGHLHVQQRQRLLQLRRRQRAAHVAVHEDEAVVQLADLLRRQVRHRAPLVAFLDPRMRARHAANALGIRPRPPFSS
mmetsp:Transcript_40169/g.76784  ORF Transcript_40169/g.76784 Transcript_40169/m.76784 type:complete len:273 (+) Transcript_40169:1305-2123(+)